MATPALLPLRSPTRTGVWSSVRHPRILHLLPGLLLALALTGCSLPLTHRDLASRSPQSGPPTSLARQVPSVHFRGASARAATAPTPAAVRPFSAPGPVGRAVSIPASSPTSRPVAPPGEMPSDRIDADWQAPRLAPPVETDPLRPAGPLSPRSPSAIIEVEPSTQTEVLRPLPEVEGGPQRTPRTRPALPPPTAVETWRESPEGRPEERGFVAPTGPALPQPATSGGRTTSPSTTGSELLPENPPDGPLSAEPVWGPAMPGDAGEEDNFWIVSSRSARLPAGAHESSLDLAYLQGCRGGLVRQPRERFLGSLRPDRPVCVVIHGSYNYWPDVLRESRRCREWIARAAQGQPVQLVFFTWPANGYVPVAFPVELAVLGRRSAYHGVYVANLLCHFPADQPVCLVGHSHGARCVAASLHALGGGAVEDGTRLAPGLTPPHRVRGVLLAAAIDHNWLNPGGRYGQALRPVEKLLVVHNHADGWLRVYSWKNLLGNSSALGQSGLSANDHFQLADLNHKVVLLDATRMTGNNHDFNAFNTRPEFADAISPMVLFQDDAGSPGRLPTDVGATRPGRPSVPASSAQSPVTAVPIDADLSHATQVPSQRRGLSAEPIRLPGPARPQGPVPPVGRLGVSPESPNTSGVGPSATAPRSTGPAAVGPSLRSGANAGVGVNRNRGLRRPRLSGRVGPLAGPVRSGMPVPAGRMPPAPRGGPGHSPALSANRGETTGMVPAQRGPVAVAGLSPRLETYGPRQGIYPRQKGANPPRPGGEETRRGPIAGQKTPAGEPGSGVIPESRGERASGPTLREAAYGARVPIRPAGALRGTPGGSDRETESRGKDSADDRSPPERKGGASRQPGDRPHAESGTAEPDEWPRLSPPRLTLEQRGE